MAPPQYRRAEKRSAFRRMRYSLRSPAVSSTGPQCTDTMRVIGQNDPSVDVKRHSCAYLAYGVAESVDMLRQQGASTLEEHAAEGASLFRPTGMKSNVEFSNPRYEPIRDIAYHWLRYRSCYVHLGSVGSTASKSKSRRLGNRTTSLSLWLGVGTGFDTERAVFSFVESRYTDTAFPRCGHRLETERVSNCWKAEPSIQGRGILFFPVHCSWFGRVLRKFDLFGCLFNFAVRKVMSKRFNVNQH